MSLRGVGGRIDKEHRSQTGTDLMGGRPRVFARRQHLGQGLRRRAVLHATTADPGQRRRRRCHGEGHGHQLTCGTHGFPLLAHEHAARNAKSMTLAERRNLRMSFGHGPELVDGPARLGASNMLLQGIGKAEGASVIEAKDPLIADPGQRRSVVLAAVPFGRQSSPTMVGAEGRKVREELDIERPDFGAMTSNKCPDGLRHIMTVLS